MTRSLLMYKILEALLCCYYSWRKVSHGIFSVLPICKLFHVCIHPLTVRFTQSWIWASDLSLKISCAWLSIPVVLQAAGQITVLMHQLTWLPVRLKLLWCCNSKPERSIQTSNLENSSSVMFSLEFSCCVCSCLQNWRSKGSSMGQKPFFFTLCCLCVKVCVFAPPLPSHLQDSAGFLNPIPEAGGCQESCRVVVQHGQARTQDCPCRKWWKSLGSPKSYPSTGWGKASPSVNSQEVWK